VPRYKRYDVDGASEQELAQRWRTFHRQVRSTTSGRAARLLAPLLGDDTARRRLAQSLLQRRSSGTTATSLAPQAITVRDLNRLRPSHLISSAEATAAIAVVPVRLDNLDETFSLIEASLAGDATWLLFVGPVTDHADMALASLWPFTTDADVVFADEDSSTGPVLKAPTVGRYALHSANIVGRPVLVRSKALRRIGGVRREAGVAFEWDLFLRLHEQEARFVHAPVLLPSFSTADVVHHASFAADSCRVVRESWSRAGLVAEAIPGERLGTVQWRIAPTSWPSVDIVIPTRDRVDLVRRCVDSITSRSTYPNFRITMLDNDSTDPDTLDYFAATPHSVVKCPGPFNYAAIMNRGVRSTSAAYIVTLNNDTVIDTPDWLERLVEAVSLPDVGLVGCRNVDPEGGHDHDGVIIAPYPQHLRGGVNWPLSSTLTSTTRELTAVTGAVTMVRREAWDAIGGMDETLAVVMNDIDFCLRLQNEGWLVLIVPSVAITHFTSSSRGRLDPLADRNRFVRRWDIFGSFIDPYFPDTLQLYGSTMVALPSLDFGAPKENL